MVKRISAISAAVAGALLIGTGAQAASDGQLVCDRPLSSSTPANCVWQSANAPAERIAVVTSGEPVRSGSSGAVVSGSGAPVRSGSNSERVLIVSEPASAGAPVYIIEPAGSRMQRGDQVVIVTEPAIVEPRESSRGDAFPDPSPPSTIVEPRRSDRYLDPSDTRDRALGRHSQPQ
jgi:hypothetical protein